MSKLPKKPDFDHEKIQTAVEMMFEAIGEQRDETGEFRSGIRGTPDRVARAFEEMFEGCKYTNKEIAEANKVLFDNDTKGIVVEKISGPGINSMCEHHLLPMYDTEVFIGYIPHGKVIGLSKLARIVQLTGHRPGLQETWGDSIAECVQIATGSEDVAVVINSKHGCITLRGAKSNLITKTAALHGKFFELPELRAEFYELIKDIKE